MKYSIDLISESSDEWLDTVMKDFNSFLQDHADCERKASSMAMSLIAKYPNRKEIIPELIETAREELDHFQQVYEIMAARDVPLPHEMGKDPYINELMQLTHGGTAYTRFRDRLLIASVIECRGFERFKRVEERLEDPGLKKFYKMLWTSEAKHGNIFVKMALHYFPEKEVYDRLEDMMGREARIIENLPLRPALH